MSVTLAWGSVGEWAMVIVTLLGLGLTAIGVFKSVADRRTEAVHGIALSSFVASEDLNADRVLIKWELMNASPVAFDDVVITVSDPGSPNMLIEHVVGTVLPKQSKWGELSVERPVGSMPFRWYTAPAALLYVDPWGRAWRRHAGPPQRSRAGPRVC